MVHCLKQTLIICNLTKCELQAVCDGGVHEKASRHLVCDSCSNRVDFVKSGCEKSWAEAQADSF